VFDFFSYSPIKFSFIFLFGESVAKVSDLCGDVSFAIFFFRVALLSRLAFLPLIFRRPSASVYFQSPRSYSSDNNLLWLLKAIYSDINLILF